MRSIALVMLVMPSLLGGLISRQAWWAAGLGALFMYVFMIGTSPFQDPDLVIARNEIAMALASMLLFGAILGLAAFSLRRIAVEVWHTPSKAREIVASVMIMLAAYTLSLGMAAAWFYSIWDDIRYKRFLMFAFDFFLPPLGILRGLLKYFGLL
jgi:hypothetical protein